MLAQHQVPSIAVAYIRDGAVAWTRVYGEQADGVPATTRTLYNVASLTKPVFAELVVRLTADGRLSLDEAMASHWVDPDIASDQRHKALTPRVALSHRTGFANWRRATGGVLRFQFAPGTAYRYSGEGYQYLARFVERKLGASLDALAKQYVFAPFGMTSTAFAKQEWFGERVAIPKGPEGKYGQPSFQARGNAADDMHTTIGDYAAFVVGVMRSYGGQRDSIHSADTGDGASCDAKKVARCPARVGYGLGWSIMEYPDGPVLWHTGADWGEKAMVFYFPKQRAGAVMLANSANGFQPMIDIGALLFQGTDFADFLTSARR